MAIYIDTVDFDNGVNITPFYQANTGDLVTATMIVRGRVRVSSVNNTLSLDPTINVVSSPSVSWLEEGFRVGDWVLAIERTNGGAVITQFWTQVVSVTDFECDFTTMPSFYNVANNEIMEFIVVTGNGSNTAVARDEVDVLFNQVKNSTQGTINSLIDGEVTRLRFSGLAGLAIGGTISGLELGNKSGAMIYSSELERLVQIDNEYRYQITIQFVNTGMFDDGSWFFTGECLKSYFRTEWARVLNEPYARTVKTYNLNGDTGYFDEPFNTGIVDSTLVQGVTELDYCVPTLRTVIVDGPLTDLQIGMSYLSTDDTYYKNQYPSQKNLSMVLAGVDVALGTYSSEQNTSGAGYDVEITDITVIGSQTSIEFLFTPNTAFNDFMDSRDALDRRFLVWVKCGSINHLVYSDNLTCTPPEADPLVMETSVAFSDHAENVDTFTGDYVFRDFNIEDDFGYFGTFLLEKDAIYDRFSIYMEASNQTTGEDFSLRVIQYNFNGVQVSGDGRYLLDETIAVNAGLPTTSKKIDSRFKLEPSLDTPTEYGVSIYAPFILDWRYWIEQTNASTDFYPDQNKDWENYERPLQGWSVRLRLELVRDGFGHNHTEEINIFDYDTQPVIQQEIELLIDSTNQVIGIVTEGQLMRVRATHTLLNNQAWNPDETWGMITVEPFESQPRSICSTAVPFDYNSNNPLTPLSGVLMDITYPLPNVAQMECYFNPDLINTDNGVKFTTKIKGCPEDEQLLKTTTDGLIKTTTQGDGKTLAI